MKTKIFYIYGNGDKREKEINKWLEENSPNVKFIKQSPDTESQSTIVTIWYNE